MGRDRALLKVSKASMHPNEGTGAALLGTDTGKHV